MAGDTFRPQQIRPVLRNEVAMVHLDLRPVKKLPEICGPYLEIKWYRLFPYQHAIPKVAN